MGFGSSEEVVLSSLICCVDVVSQDFPSASEELWSSISVALLEYATPCLEWFFQNSIQQIAWNSGFWIRRERMHLNTCMETAHTCEHPTRTLVPSPQCFGSEASKSS